LDGDADQPVPNFPMLHCDMSPRGGGVRPLRHRVDATLIRELD
jgi:hypothetical protein